MAVNRVLCNGLLALVFLATLAGCTPTAPAVVPTAAPQVIKETVVVTPQVIERLVTPAAETVNKEGGVLTWGILVEPTGFNPILNDSCDGAVPNPVRTRNRSPGAVEIIRPR